MLALDHPHVLAQVLAFPGGLMTIKPGDRLSLAIKVSKEALLAVQLNRGFSVYVVPFQAGDGQACSIVSAFFDDADEPLTICTPLFGDETPSIELVGMLLSPELNIHFFDELGREWMSYRCSLHDPGSCLKTNENIRLVPFSQTAAADILGYLREWFSVRTAADDARAIKVCLEEELWPSDIFILDARDRENAYIGSDGYAMSMLSRGPERPGYFQERDIVAGLRRVLEADQIILNPLRQGTDKEFVDVVAGMSDIVLLVQAKDSPNTPASLARSISRKERTSVSQLAAAMKQVKGALRYVAQGEPVLLTAGKEDVNLYIAGRELMSLVVITEIFPSQVPTIVALMRGQYAQGHILLVLDYRGLSGFIGRFTAEDRFVSELLTYAERVRSAEGWISADAFLVGRYLEDHASEQRDSEAGQAP